MQGIPEDIIDEIRQRTDLVGLVGEYLKLERRGKNMVGLCPFHNEKTPSFSVSPDKQLYHCFGCGASGNAFSLIMQMENMTFPEAARALAGRAGVTIPERKAPSGEDNLKEKIYKLNELATRFFAYHLNNTESGKKAIEYLQKRGINQETIELFKLGYAPEGWTGFFDFAKKKGAPPDLIVKSGLASPGREKGHYDRFRNRIIFPIFNLSGKVAGFGGRALEDGGKSGPKYLNSPETPVFSKGSILYALNLARDEIRRQKKAVVMEGYTDVITAYQAGIKNSVASLGTSLTAEQGRLLRYQAETVVTAYDSDSAGEAATWRGLAILQSSGCLVQVADLPADTDPDNYIREKGPEHFNKLIDSARPLMEYRLQQLKKRFDLESDKGRIDYTEELMSLLLAAVNQVEQDFYLRRAAEEMDIDEDALRSELKNRRTRGSRYKEAEQKEMSKDQEKIIIRPEEKTLISLMLQSKEIAEQGRNILQIEYIGDPKIRKVIEDIWDFAAGETVFSAEKFLSRFEDQEIVKIITEAVTEPSLQDLPLQTAKRNIEDSVNRLHKIWVTKKLRDLRRKRESYEAQGLLEEANKLFLEEQELSMNKDGDSYRLGKGGDFND